MSAVEPLKARRLYLLLRDAIVSGEEPPRARLPSEPMLAERHGVSRVTVRRALDQLAAEGLVERRPGSGTFVAAGRARAPLVADFSNVLTHLVEMGRRTDVRLLSFAYVRPAEPIARALHLRRGERAQRSVRVRYIDGKPFSHLVTHVPERVGVAYSEADLAARPLLELLERSGVVAERAEQTIGAALAGPDVAEALGVDIGAALLSMTRVVYDAAGQGVEHLQALYRPDRYSFHLDLLRTGAAGARRWSPVERPALRAARAADRNSGDRKKDRSPTRRRQRS
ncbi:MAG: GntR family transcriptional regulator [Methylobacteriaceae bacterium]|nr:GntR family transcriptional regulator [Methylobacteriaceae bacterium]